jgi:hypothetical protein
MQPAGRGGDVSQAQFAAGACVAAEDATADAGDAGASRGPGFVANSNGEVIRVPEGAEDPVPAESGKGFQFIGGSGGDPRDLLVTQS